jgi:hypothetical protein
MDTDDWLAARLMYPGTVVDSARRGRCEVGLWVSVAIFIGGGVCDNANAV